MCSRMGLFIEPLRTLLPTRHGLVPSEDVLYPKLYLA